LTDKGSKDFTIGRYDDALHAEVMEDILVGEFGYKYRILDDVVMPPYITPARYQVSRTVAMRPDDICFTGFPKSGSTWLSYVLLMITRSGEVPTDTTLRDCVQWVASSFTYPRSREELDVMASPRIFKSHMPYHMAVGGCPVDSQCRYIYIARNPKDVIVSYYYFERSKSWAGGYDGSWDHWLRMFMEGKIQRGDWFDHVLSWWEHRHAENILFLKYEDMRKDIQAEATKMAQFLDYPMSPSLLAAIEERTSFRNMREDEFSNMHEIEELGGFFRKGRAGSWQEQFSPSQNELFNEVYDERMAGTDLVFAFDE
jgi:sulfotransferase